MKKIIISTLISIITLLVLTLITSLVVSVLQFNNGIKISPYLIEIISLVLFMISGLVFGLINKKQGLLGSILFILVYLVFVLIFDVILKTHDTYKLYFLFVIGKCVSYCIGAVLSVNLRHS